MRKEYVKLGVVATPAPLYREAGEIGVLLVGSTAAPIMYTKVDGLITLHYGFDVLKVLKYLSSKGFMTNARFDGNSNIELRLRRSQFGSGSGNGR